MRLWFYNNVTRRWLNWRARRAGLRGRFGQITRADLEWARWELRQIVGVPRRMTSLEVLRRRAARKGGEA